MSYPIIDFEALDFEAIGHGSCDELFLPTCDWICLCLGTHSGKQGSYEQVDYGYTIAAAKLARGAGTPNAMLISSTLASAQSLSPYLRWKGKAEQALEALQFEKLAIFRPGPLLGRIEVRLSERLGNPLLKLLAAMMGGKRSPIAPVDGSDLASLMARQITEDATENTSGEDWQGLKRFYAGDIASSDLARQEK
ncbi:hypothetical protein ACFSJ3_13630 [Corallincola platygyrae]|uniref:NAD(P)-binding domain-containing protein n=1 Tax=Corallincola platygyrae TaxID=1193278 RepID=A0ABW4XP34_9GAMM